VQKTIRTAIVVEDEPLIRGLLEEILLGANFEVHTAGSALEARRLLNRIEPDLALLDIDLGAGANGIDIAHIIEKKHLGTATIFLTKIPDIRATPSQMELPQGASFLRKELVGNPAYLLEAIETALTELGKVRHDAEPGRPLEMLTNTQVQDHDVDIWFRKNGSTSAYDIPNTASVQTVPSTHGGQPGYQVIAANFYISITAGDFIELWWAASSTNVQLNTRPAITTPFTSPAAPSVVVTASFVSALP
jgi:CheY-like chemotaxis protein